MVNPGSVGMPYGRRGAHWCLLGPGTDLRVTPYDIPAAIARLTVTFGEQLDWERYRQRCVEAGSTPFGELDGHVAAWMDAGMFARWLLGESMP